jgi:hypothetical protein
MFKKTREPLPLGIHLSLFLVSINVPVLLSPILVMMLVKILCWFTAESGAQALCSTLHISPI